MSYNLGIGELVHYKEDGHSYTTVNTVEHKNAPADGVPTDFTNQRWPSYTGWEEFCNEVGLDINYLIRTHPGYVKITKAFQSEVNKVYEKHKDTPNHGVRVVWMKYWTDWAIINCKNPVFHNS